MLRALVLLPFLLVLVAFGLSNGQVVVFGLWPTDLQVGAPLGPAVLVVAAIFFALGAFMVWVPSLGHRLRARRAERHVQTLRTELAAKPDGVKLIPGPR